MYSSDSEGSFVWASTSSSGSSEHTGNLKAARVKLPREEESDPGAGYKEKLKKKLFSSIKNDHNDESKVRSRKRRRSSSGSASSHAERYLGLRIKQELADAAADSTTKKKRRKLSKTVGDENSSLIADIKQEVNNDVTYDISECRGEIENLVVEDKFFAEETIVQGLAIPTEEYKRHKKSKRKRKLSIDTTESDQNTGLDGDKLRTRGTAEQNGGRSSSIDSLSRRLSTEPTTVENGTQHLQKLSATIRFEDEEDSNLDTSNTLHSDSYNAFPMKLRRFIRTKGDMKKSTWNCSEVCPLSSDDDIWMVKCPSEINIENLRGKDMFLEAKCKIKIDGQAYEGTTSTVYDRMTPLLCNRNGEYVIRNFPLRGIMRLRKRIPKAHFVEDVSGGQHSAPIPLPPTKRRHPLFGADYRRRVRLPAAARRRLAAPHPAPARTTPPRRARLKLASAEDWGSERAIEDNLFNF